MIRVLDKNVADKIAAGEVVERPLSIVKELVENAIDAGADSITVEIKNGGKSYIRVTDNGCGIAQGEALLAFKRHATSKIQSPSDLERIETLGFRGEALASIAAVSRCELITKPAGAKAGARVQIEASDVKSNEPVGCPDGTTIIVEDMFFNTPARHKFMKTDAAESTLIIDFISKMAIAYPNARMRMISNGNILFSTSGKGSALSAILTVYSSEIEKSLVPVAKEGEGLVLAGYTSQKGHSKPSKKMQVFFVNGRAVSSKAMERGVAEAYSDKLLSGRYPVCFLFLTMPPEMLDVNIHPNKKEVRFDDESKVSALIEDAVKEALLTKEAVPMIKRGNVFSFQKEVTESSAEPVSEESSSFMKAKREQVDINNILSTMREEVSLQLAEETAYFKEDEASYDAKKLDITRLVITGSIFSSYITAIDESSFYLIDQHAAHERVFYERLMNQYNSEEKQQQLLMAPFVVNVSTALKNTATDWICALQKAGFDIEEFGGSAFVVKAVPVFMTLGEADDFIEEFLDNAGGPADFRNAAAVEKIMSSACKAAVKAGSKLAAEEMRQLIFDLAKCDNPFNCPHGRPTLVRLTKDEIEKMFKRK
ncbi:MAG: DNA mismatch repair endonuclease MutL [Clostridiales bacterium]|nr:DNA mismatch repair endonuclease MutL [Clostridiales bacterium]